MAFSMKDMMRKCVRDLSRSSPDGLSPSRPPTFPSARKPSSKVRGKAPVIGHPSHAAKSLPKGKG